jgi:hypothetical protein
VLSLYASLLVIYASLRRTGRTSEGGWRWKYVIGGGWRRWKGWWRWEGIWEGAWEGRWEEVWEEEGGGQ